MSDKYTKLEMQENFNTVIKYFDFDKIIKVTNYLNYNWKTINSEPTINDLKIHITNQFYRIDENTISTSFDGFLLEIDWRTGEVHLKYILEHSIGMFID